MTALVKTADDEADATDHQIHSEKHKQEPEKHHRHNATRTQTAFAGSVAGLASRTVTAPLDVLKIRLQLSPSPFIPTLRSLLTTEGPLALWKGNAPASLLYLLYGAVQFSTYSVLPAMLPLSQSATTADGGSAVLSSAATSAFIAGGMAAFVATTATYPLDLLRTRLAATITTPSSISNRYGRTGKIVPLITEMYRHEGHMSAFFQGATAAQAAIVPHMAVFFAGYESLRSPGGGAWTAGPAGLIAGVAAKAAVFPLDSVRRRMQVQRAREQASLWGGVAAEHTKGEIEGVSRQLKGMIAVARRVVRTEGMRGLYRGIWIGIGKAAPASAVTMWTYENVLRTLEA